MNDRTRVVIKHRHSHEQDSGTLLEEVKPCFGDNRFLASVCLSREEAAVRPSLCLGLALVVFPSRAGLGGPAFWVGMTHES